ncbi:hypothetical protein PoB_004825800 [Plakobranchus ocellatus]|uniref:Uncharacterized protein n=1 Tax=Plakobranchus ocellatus TaxID=259542 RepID=A0AAV4BRJ5_9GAST|nr:hypothetical protein PoB_004825800 [Plakobranchus ocellatus]
MPDEGTWTGPTGAERIDNTASLYVARRDNVWEMAGWGGPTSWSGRILEAPQRRDSREAYNMWKQMPYRHKDYHLKDLVRLVPSYVQGDIDFLPKIPNINERTSSTRHHLVYNVCQRLVH